jgi:hypothetical protein
MTAMQQTTPNHRGETFSSGQTQYFECEALSTARLTYKCQSKLRVFFLRSFSCVRANGTPRLPERSRQNAATSSAALPTRFALAIYEIQWNHADDLRSRRWS